MMNDYVSYLTNLVDDDMRKGTLYLRAVEYDGEGEPFRLIDGFKEPTGKRFKTFYGPGQKYPTPDEDITFRLIANTWIKMIRRFNNIQFKEEDGMGIVWMKADEQSIDLAWSEMKHWTREIYQTISSRLYQINEGMIVADGEIPRIEDGPQEDPEDLDKRVNLERYLDTVSLTYRSLEMLDDYELYLSERDSEIVERLMGRLSKILKSNDR